MTRIEAKTGARIKRRRRIRGRIRGTAERPRLSVYRSARHIYAQIINDDTGVVLTSASTVDRELRGTVKNGGNADAAREVGKLLATRAVEKRVQSVTFDRGGFRYHGRVKALAEAAREGGLKF
ncbi:MAG: 50S ribosomal protein L18 [bacterium]|nr:MAG: 50S ribosomal protein L18 [bacterium]